MHKRLIALLALAGSCSSPAPARPGRRPGRPARLVVPPHRHRDERQGHGREAAEAHRLALADRHRVAVRDRCRRSGRRRRRPVGLPEVGPEDDALGLHARTSRRSSPTGPTSSSSRTTPATSPGSLEKLGITVVHMDAAKTLKGAYQQIRQLGRVTGHEDEAGAARHPDAAEDRLDRRGDQGEGDGQDRLPRAEPRPLLGHLARRSPGASTRCSGLRTSPTRPTRRAAGTRSSPRSTSSSKSPDLDRARRHGLLRSDRGRRSPVGPAGARSALSAQGRSCAIDDSLASRWGPRIVDFVRAIGAALGRFEELGHVSVVGARPGDPPPARPDPARLGVCRGRVPRRLGRRRRPRRPGRHRRARHPPFGRGAAAHSGGRHRALDRARSRSSGSYASRVSSLAVLVGGMLSLAGGTYQGVFRNPLADPVPPRHRGGGRPRRDPRGRVPPGRVRRPAALPAGGVRGWGGGSRAHVPRRPLDRPRARRDDPRARRGHRDRRSSRRVQTFVQQQHADTLQQVYSWILGRLPSSGWGDVRLIAPYVVVASRRHPRAPSRRRRAQPRRRRGDEPRREHPPPATDPRRRGDGGHRRRGRRQRADRVRRDHRARTRSGC